ncbi:MAG: NYN domain-containing protein [Deltaproteobacteria bacterium]|nr:NYN domain-containing protein [Deltaproteobacteria bacterium]
MCDVCYGRELAPKRACRFCGAALPVSAYDRDGRPTCTECFRREHRLARCSLCKQQDRPPGSIELVPLWSDRDAVTAEPHRAARRAWDRSRSSTLGALLSGRHPLPRVLVLVTGDSDFVPPVKFARREGILVYLEALGHGVRPELKAHCDRTL